MIINGIDVTDPNKTYTSQEWAHLRGFYDVINQRRQRATGPATAQGRNQGRIGGRGRGPVNDEISARSVQALQQANHIMNEIAANLNQDPDETANAGNNFSPASYGGRHVRFEGRGGRGPRTASKITTKTRRAISSSRTHTNPLPDVVQSNCELDSHADMCCLGANFVPLYFTGKVCDVSPFLDSMPTQENVEVCTGATAYDDENGETIILVVNEALWMGGRMRHSLLNPYQVRAAGIILNDDPTNEERYFGLEADKYRVHFQM